MSWRKDFPWEADGFLTWRSDDFVKRASLQKMSWETDGRRGKVKFDGTEMAGVALMRDRSKGVVAFHALGDEAVARPGMPGQFVITEDDFQPDVPAGNDGKSP